MIIYHQNPDEILPAGVFMIGQARKPRSFAEFFGRRAGFVTRTLGFCRHGCLCSVFSSGGGDKSSGSKAFIDASKPARYRFADPIHDHLWKGIEFHRSSGSSEFLP